MGRVGVGIAIIRLQSLFFVHLGVSKNKATTISHPKMIDFEQENQWLLGTTILGNPHIVLRKCLSPETWVGKLWHLFSDDSWWKLRADFSVKSSNTL